MNSARIAALLRELADAIEDTAEVPAAPRSSPRQRKPREIVRPAGEASAAVTGQAARILRERGLR